MWVALCKHYEPDPVPTLESTGDPEVDKGLELIRAWTPEPEGPVDEGNITDEDVYAALGQLFQRTSPPG